MVNKRGEAECPRKSSIIKIVAASLSCGCQPLSRAGKLALLSPQQTGDTIRPPQQTNIGIFVTKIHESISLLIQQITWSRSVVAIISLSCFILSYVFLPSEIQVVLNKNTPKFLPFSLTLFDIFAFCIAIVSGLFAYGFLRLLECVRDAFAKPPPNALVSTINNELSNNDIVVLVILIFKPVNLKYENHLVQIALKKLERKKIIEHIWVDSYRVASEAEEYIHHLVETREIDVSTILSSRDDY